jgi:sugar phosphate isomerase/epimerase
MAISRRAAAALLVSAPTAVLLGEGRAHAAEPVPDTNRIGGFAIGCQAYSFNRFSVMEAIEKTAQAGGKTIEFYPGQRVGPDPKGPHLEANAPDDVLAQVKAQLDKFGIRPVAFGVVGLGKNEASNRQVFEFAKKMGLMTITTEPDASALDLIEKLVKEYDIRVAIHNHPKRDNDANYRYWDPKYVLSLVKDRDPRIGSCADTGHWTRSGIKPIDAIKLLKGRVLGSHLKDLNEFSPRAHDMPYGTGVGQMSVVLEELRRNKFDGHISIEYEYNWDNSVPEIAQCIGYVRGWSSLAKK